MVVWRRWVFPILLLVIFGLIAAALVKVAFFPDEQTAAEVPSAGISDPVIPVERGSIVNQLDVSGTVARDAPVPLRADIDGVVTEVFVGEGHVDAGQVLFRVKQNDPVRDLEFLFRVAHVLLLKSSACSDVPTLRPSGPSVN